MNGANIRGSHTLNLINNSVPTKPTAEANTMNLRWLVEVIFDTVIAFVLMIKIDLMEFFVKTKTACIKWRNIKFQLSSIMKTNTLIISSLRVMMTSAGIMSILWNGMISKKKLLVNKL